MKKALPLVNYSEGFLFKAGPLRALACDFRMICA
jgi:hypothetical protein